MSILSKKIGTTEVSIRADFADAASPIHVRYSDCGDDAPWETTGKQVADFRHKPKAALEHFCK